jgi:hypothetical protein
MAEEKIMEKSTLFAVRVWGIQPRLLAWAEHFHHCFEN